MEPLIAVYTASEKRSGNDKPVIVSGWSWIKNEKEAVDKCKKKISVNGNLISVHTALWRNAPSEYKQVYGQTNCSPVLDMAANLRSGHLRKSRKEVRQELRRNKQEMRLVESAKEKPPEVPRFILITAQAAA